MPSQERPTGEPYTLEVVEERPLQEQLELVQGRPPTVEQPLAEPAPRSPSEPEPVPGLAQEEEGYKPAARVLPQEPGPEPGVHRPRASPAPESVPVLDTPARVTGFGY